MLPKFAIAKHIKTAATVLEGPFLCGDLARTGEVDSGIGVSRENFSTLQTCHKLLTSGTREPLTSQAGTVGGGILHSPPRDLYFSSLVMPGNPLPGQTLQVGRDHMG